MHDMYYYMMSEIRTVRRMGDMCMKKRISKKKRFMMLQYLYPRDKA